MLTDFETISSPYRLDTMTLHSGIGDGGNQSWDRITEMKVPRWGACGTAAHGKIFIAGGSAEGGSPSLDTCEVYNIEADEWQLIASLNSPRFSGSMVYLKGILYVVGGRGRNVNKRVMAVESYDFEKKKWKERTKLPINKTFPEWKYDSCVLNIPRILINPILKRQQGLLRPLLLRSRQSAFSSLVCYENNLRERMRTKNMERHIGVPKQYIVFTVTQETNKLQTVQWKRPRK